MSYPWKFQPYTYDAVIESYLKPALKQGTRIPYDTVREPIQSMISKCKKGKVQEQWGKHLPLQEIIDNKQKFISIAEHTYKIINKKDLLRYMLRRSLKPNARYRKANELWLLYEKMCIIIGFWQRKLVLCQVNKGITHACPLTKKKMTKDNDYDFFFAEGQYYEKKALEKLLWIWAEKREKTIGSAIVDYKDKTRYMHRVSTSLLGVLKNDWLPTNPSVRDNSSKSSFNLPGIGDIYNSITNMPGSLVSFLFSANGARFVASAVAAFSEPSRNERFGKPQFRYALGSGSSSLSSHVQTSNTPSFIPFGTVPQEYVHELPAQRTLYEEIESKEIFAWSENEKELLAWFRSIDKVENTGFLGRSGTGEIKLDCTFPNFKIKKFLVPYSKSVTGDNSAMSTILYRKNGRHEDMHGLVALRNIYSGDCYCSGFPYSTQNGRDRFIEASTEMENNLKQFAIDVKSGRSTNADTLSKNLAEAFRKAAGWPYYVMAELDIPQRMERIDAKTYKFYPYREIYAKSYLPLDAKTEFANLFSQSLYFNAQYYFLEATLTPGQATFLYPNKQIDTILLAIYLFFDHMHKYRYDGCVKLNPKPRTHKLTANSLRLCADIERLQKYWDYFSPDVIKHFSPKLSVFYDGFFQEIADIKAGKRDEYLRNCNKYIPQYESNLFNDAIEIERFF